MNDYKDINDLISSTDTNKSAYVDYLLEYAEGDYHCLDGSADNEILAFSSFAIKFKHIYALAILLKLQESIDTSKFAKAFSYDFQIIIKKESEELENLLFYIRHSLPEDFFRNNCDKFKNGNGIIQNKWNYPYDIIEMQEKQIEMQEKQIRYLMEECQGERFQERICVLLETLHDMEHKLENLKRRLEIEKNKCANYKHSLVDIKDQLVNMVARNPTHEGMLHKLEGMLYELNTFINGL